MGPLQGNRHNRAIDRFLVKHSVILAYAAIVFTSYILESSTQMDLVVIAKSIQACHISWHPTSELSRVIHRVTAIGAESASMQQINSVIYRTLRHENYL